MSAEDTITEMKQIKHILLLLVVFIVNSCKTDLNLLAPYKESVAVYALLNQYDSVQYIRVNRVFLGAQNANTTAQIKDSVYFKPGEATVYIEKYMNGYLKQKINFIETYEKPLAPGAFNSDQLIYRSNQKLKSDSETGDIEYRLTVKNNTTGKIYTAKTKLIQDLTASIACKELDFYCFLNTPNVSITSSMINTTPAAIPKTFIKYGAPVNARICSFALRFFYSDSLFDGTKAQHYIDMNFGERKTKGLGGSDVMEFTFFGDEFYKTVAKNIHDDPSVMNRMADSINFFIIAGGEELNLYNEINGTSGAFGQEKPYYSNISDGLGIFSSRYIKKINKTFYNCKIGSGQSNVLTSQTLESLATGRFTCELRFKYCDNNLNYITNTGCK